MEQLKSQLKVLLIRRELFIAMVRAEVTGKYKGTMLGLIWPFVSPLFMLLVYTFIFSDLVGSKWASGHQSSKLDFSLFVFCGLIAYNMATDVLMSAPSKIRENMNLVKKVVFPLEFLSFVGVVNALINFLIAFLLLLIVMVILKGSIHLAVLWVPVILLPFLLLLASASLALSGLGVFVKDITYLISYFCNALLFLSPVFYSAQAAPALFKKVLVFNPLTIVIEHIRSVVIGNGEINYPMLGAYYLVSIVIFTATYYCFVQARKYFADNL